MGVALVVEPMTMLLPLPACESSRTRLRMRLIDPIRLEESTIVSSADYSVFTLARFIPKSMLALKMKRVVVGGLSLFTSGALH